MCTSTMVLTDPFDFVTRVIWVCNRHPKVVCLMIMSKHQAMGSNDTTDSTNTVLGGLTKAVATLLHGCSLPPT